MSRLIFYSAEQTRHFWLTNSSGVSEAGKTITWEWEMYGTSPT